MSLAVLHLLWDLSQPGARCTVDDLEQAVHEGGIARFSQMPGLHQKTWFRDRDRYGSFMVFASAAARDAAMETITERVSARSGLPPARVEAYEVIASVEGASGPVPADRVGSGR